MPPPLQMVLIFQLLLVPMMPDPLQPMVRRQLLEI